MRRTHPPLQLLAQMLILSCDSTHRIQRLQGGADATLTASASLSSTTYRKPWSRPPISLDFQVLMFTASGLLVRFLKVFERSDYNSVKVRRGVSALVICRHSVADASACLCTVGALLDEGEWQLPHPDMKQVVLPFFAYDTPPPVCCLQRYLCSPFPLRGDDHEHDDQRSPIERRADTNHCA